MWLTSRHALSDLDRRATAMTSADLALVSCSDSLGLRHIIPARVHPATGARPACVDALDLECDERVERLIAGRANGDHHRAAPGEDHEGVRAIDADQTGANQRTRSRSGARRVTGAQRQLGPAAAVRSRPPRWCRRACPRWSNTGASAGSVTATLVPADGQCARPGACAHAPATQYSRECNLRETDCMEPNAN